MDNPSIETQFFNWLAGNVSPAQLSTLYTVYPDISEFCLSRKILKKPLFETFDLNVLAKVRETVDRNQVFKFTYKKQSKMMSLAIAQYIKYVKEHSESFQEKCTSDPQKNDVNLGTTSAINQSAATIIDLINDAGISFVDNRAKSGCLWIVGADELKSFVEQCKTVGVEFHFKDHARALGGNAGWWTDDDIKTVIKQSAQTNADEPARANRGEFIRWMSEKGIGNGRILTHLSYVKQCGTFAQSVAYISCDIYDITDPDTIQMISGKLLTDPSFVQSNKKNQGHLSESLSLYLEYLEGKRITMNAQSAPADGDKEEIEVFLSDTLFAPLVEELKRNNIRKVSALRTIKLWPFMNQHNLYSIATRQAVLAKVQTLLNPVAEEDKHSVYKIISGDNTFTGATLSNAYLKLCEDLARQYPLKIRSIIEKQVGQTGRVAIYKTNPTGNYLKMSNPVAYVDNDLSTRTAWENIQWLFGICTGNVPALDIVEPAEGVEPQTPVPTESESPVESKMPDSINQINSSTAEVSNPIEVNPEKTEPTLTTYEKGMVEKVENAVLQADMEGTTYDALHDELDITYVAAKRYVFLSKHIAEIKGKIYHDEALIDWSDGADKLEDIIEKLMQKNSGYISAAQLYEYARVEMNMFLNDNDMNDERSVFDIAQHLFSKVNYHNKTFTFTGKMHISRASDAITSNFDVFTKYASDQGGVFEYTDLVEYLSGIGIKTGNLRNQLRVYSDPYFFYIEEGVLISAESMKIDEEWKNTIRKALDNLFSDVGDHIILREIQPFWFDQLPSLPSGRTWTPLLLQSVLKFWNKEFGARTIVAMDTQGIDTLHTMLVSTDCPIQNFGDVVIAYLLENEIDQRSFEAEELRELLIGSHMIRGNELIYNMPKALGGDERFAWDAKGNNVTVRV